MNLKNIKKMLLSAAICCLCLHIDHVQAADTNLAYGERDGIIVIDAADAMLDTEYASYENKTAAQSGISGTDFTWVITENPNKFRLLLIRSM